MTFDAQPLINSNCKLRVPLAGKAAELGYGESKEAIRNGTAVSTSKTAAFPACKRPAPRYRLAL